VAVRCAANSVSVSPYSGQVASPSRGHLSQSITVVAGHAPDVTEGSDKNTECNQDGEPGSLKILKRDCPVSRLLVGSPESEDPTRQTARPLTCEEAAIEAPSLKGAQLDAAGSRLQAATDNKEGETPGV